MAGKCIAELGQKLADPIDSRKETASFRPVGNVELQVKRAYSVNKALAKQGYVKELGARSIMNTIDRDIEVPLVGSYLASREEIDENQPACSCVVGVGADLGDVEVLQCSLEGS